MFFTHSRLFTALYPTFCVKKRKNTKKSFKLLFMKSQKFHGDSVKNESARAKKARGGGRQTPPPPSLFTVKEEQHTVSQRYQLLKIKCEKKS